MESQKRMITLDQIIDTRFILLLHVCNLCYYWLPYVIFLFTKKKKKSNDIDNEPIWGDGASWQVSLESDHKFNRLRTSNRFK